MRRITVLLVALATAAIPGAGLALAHDHKDGADTGGPTRDVHVYSGVVVSVDTAAGTIVAEVNGGREPRARSRRVQAHRARDVQDRRRHLDLPGPQGRGAG